MNIKVTEHTKNTITISELPMMKRLIKEMKDDTGLNDYAQIAAGVAIGNSSAEILKAEAEVVRNPRVYDRYFEGSGSLDIELHIYALSRIDGFYEIMICLTDIWEVTGYNDEEIREHMYIGKYTECKK